MSITEYMVKGVSIQSKIDFVRDYFGSKTETILRTILKEQISFPVLASTWYSFLIYDEILCWITENYFYGDATRLKDVGAYSAKQAFDTVYQPYMKGKNVEEFFDRISGLYGRFYNAGTMNVSLKLESNTCEIQHRDAPIYTEGDFYISAGFLLEATRLLGYPNAKCCETFSEEGFTFILTW